MTASFNNFTSYFKYITRQEQRSHLIPAYHHDGKPELSWMSPFSFALMIRRCYIMNLNVIQTLENDHGTNHKPSY